LSLTTIKRAKVGLAVSFRIAREFACFFDVLVTRIVRAEHIAMTCHHWRTLQWHWSRSAMGRYAFRKMIRMVLRGKQALSRRHIR
jgi:hypothetical protein